MPAFEAETANEAWRKAVEVLRANSTDSLQDGRGGATNEALHVVLEIHSPLQRWVVDRVPAISVAFAIVEVIGIMNGRRDSAYLNFFNPALPDFAGHGAEYHGAYGHRIRQNLGFDQLDRAYSALLHNRNGRQTVLQIWDGKQDFPNEDGTPCADDIPCNLCSILKIRNGKLEWAQIMRSNDLFKGLPYNIVQFTSLQEIVAGWLGVEVGSYAHFSDSLHLYAVEVAQAYRHDDVFVASNTDSLALPRGESDRIWAEMNRRVNLLVSTAMPPGAYEEMARFDGALLPFSNLMRVVVADAARRHGLVDIAYDIMERCTNPALTQLWARWATRKKAVRAASVDSLTPKVRTESA
jgi:thymidylate synthase